MQWLLVAALSIGIHNIHRQRCTCRKSMMSFLISQNCTLEKWLVILAGYTGGPGIINFSTEDAEIAKHTAIDILH